MNYDEIKKLMDDMGNANIDELKIEFPEGMKISMKKNAEKEVIEVKQKSIENNIESTEKRIEKQEENKCKEDYKIIKSPMVGTFYASPSPDKAPFVKVGDNIKKGQIVCIVEAMKLMNEIESEFDGEVIEVCIKDGDVVDYGKPLFKIK